MGFTSCDDDDAPAAENEEEVIDNVILTFTPAGSSAPVVVSAIDPDGDGAADFTTPSITLSTDETYTLTLSVNNIAEGEDITAEIREEDEEHMFFFEFTSGLFADPAGNGNVDSRDGAVNYDASENDAAGYPLGLTTVWQTAATAQSGTFRIILKHQPDIKSATSTAQDGESDIDLEFDITIN
ncbi:hypothetical protein JR347_02915 [Fulvivirga lutea]|uniref:Type 1 periplasmic binding fold superfamily protein n=1 Tax=Fulvivirga lutea TaxID=2810512 RepID=A0A975A2X5_9BACT|nr:hypothetical protein JR347_02915 [Fulvivirga lutea]